MNSLFRTATALLISYIIIVVISVLSGYYNEIKLFEHDYLIYKFDYYQHLGSFHDEPLLHLLSRPFRAIDIPFSLYFYIQGFILFFVKFACNTKPDKTFFLSVIIYLLIFLPSGELLRQREALSLAFIILAFFVIKRQSTYTFKTLCIVPLLLLAFLSHTTSFIYLIPLSLSSLIPPTISPSNANLFSIKLFKLAIVTSTIMALLQIISSLDILNFLLPLLANLRFASYIYQWNNYTGSLTFIVALPFVYCFYKYSCFVSKTNIFLLTSGFLFVIGLLFIKYNLVSVQFLRAGQIFYLFFLLFEYPPRFSIIAFSPLVLLLLSGFFVSLAL